MSVWDEIDRLKAAFDSELKLTKEKARELKGGALKVDEFGFWRASFRGGSKVERLRSHTSAGLLEQLREKFDVLERAKQAKRDEREAKRKAKADAREAARKRRLEERAARKPAKAGR